MFWSFLHTFGKRTNWLFYIGTLLLALQAPASFAQVNANFTAVNRSGCSPLTVQFTNLSTGPITTYQWNFGNGNTSTLPNPGVIYVTSGTYTVSLTVSDGAGSSSTHTEVNYITVFEDPQVDFTADNVAGCAPLSVNFSDLTAPGDAPITSWIWDFGDGNVSIQQNPSHTYATAGSYDVTLVVQDANGCSSSLIMSDFISVTGIASADFSATPNLGCAAPHAVSFTSSVSPIGNYSYLWDFGDGTTASTANPSHTYTIDGDYTVSMTVFDPNGCSVSITKTDYVQIHDPIADFTILDTEVCVGQTVIFTNLTTGADTYQWQFGDGNISSNSDPSHSYVAPGIYNVQLTATNSALGCSDILVRNALITVHPNPAANFSSPNRTGCAAPMSVDFVDGSTGAVAWLWDFGNGLTSTAQNPTTTYTTPGYFDVSLTITDVNGCQATEIRPSYVELLQPTADFVATPITGCIPLTVNFLDISTSTDPVVSWIWNFGDGNSSVSQNPSHTYTVSGIYPVQLIVITQSGCRDTLFSPDHIAVGTPPLVDFNANPRIVCVEDPVTFIDQTNQGFVWFWSFGDGGTSALQNPVYQYADTGTFDVTLIVNNLGCLDTLTRDSFIQVVGPIADFILTPAQGCDPPLDVSFFDQSINANGWFWDFGDGNTSTLQNPMHTYTTVGNYTITLVVTDSVSGCSDDFTLPVVITDPQANFSATPTFGCIGLAVPFTNNSTDANTYQWDFGDGNTSVAANPSHTYANPGTYDVTLIASDGTCADTLVRNAFIQIAGPDVDFVADTFNGCAPFTVSFTDLSVAPSGAAITNWFWDFGDGGISNTMNPAYTYNTAGIFDVTLQVIDSDGCTSSITKTGYVNPTFPNAEFTSNDTISCPGALISFISQASGVGITHLWDFGDGTFSNAINPVHIFPANNSYTVTLTVTDINGCQDVTAKAGFITVGQPTANLTADNTTATCPPLTVNFSDLSSANVTQWLWEFGDGSTSSLRNPSKVYARAGLFDVTLIVTTAQGCRDTMFLDDFIQLDGPDGSFTFTPNEGCNPTDVTFTGSGVDVVNWTWDFGDGSLGFGQTVTHTYVTDTTARPVMLIEDINGCQVAITTDDSIIIRPLPAPDFAVDYTNICLGQIANFTNTSISERPVIANFWDFGDGGTSTQANPQHTYTAAGTYLVSLALTTVDGCIDSVATPITITVTAPPTANFTPSQTANCTPLAVSFTEASTGVFPLVSWEWDFDDGTTFTGQFPPAHTFTTPGVYNVSLTVVDTEGCQSTVSRALTAHPLPPVDFSASTRVGCSPINIQFTDATNGASPAAQWFWDFGDGSSTSTQQNPIHNYSADGNYTVKLIVVDANGCIDSLTRVNYIRLNHPIADFSTDASASCPPQQVNFRDESVADTTISWLWDFGDGNSSTLQHPSHVYSLPGSYDITLTVTNILGCSDSFTLPAEIEVYTPPTAVMSVSVTDACLPTTIVGTNSSTAGGTPIVGYIWNNGQGSNQTTPNSSYLYTVAGTYQMSLIAIDANGCRDTANQTITINPNPIANFVADDSISCSVANIAFTNLSTSAFPQASWEWDFGDGNTGSTTNPTHTYLNDGAYTVSLKVTDVNGCQDSLTKVNYINLDHPEADFAPITTTACPGQGITFTDLSTGPATMTAWFWDFGDGNSTTATTPVHAYANPGNYTVTLTVTDAEGCSDTEVKAALITITTPPTTSFTADVTSGCTPLTINFTDTSTPNSAALVSRLWDFGDGSGSTAPTPSHTFTTAGVYTVTLTATDANGCSDQFQMQVEALSLANVDFVANTRWSCAPTSIDFTDLTTTPFLIVSWAWDFGDGTTSIQQSPTHTYAADGVYTVTLTITDQNGCISTTSKPNYINLSHPVADFTFDNAIVCPNLPIGVTFTDASTADTTISTWLWDFGDGTTSNLQNPSHSYSTSGTYSVTLTITNVLNCGDSETKAASIQVRNAPTAAFSVDQAAGCTPLEVSFTDISTPGDAPIVNWAWDFGDGTTSLLPDPIHTFTTPGTYPVSLTTTDANGCEHTATQNIESYTLPVAGFVANQRYGCAPTAINFTDLTTGITPIVSWTWDFGDGNTASVQNPSHTYTADGTYDVQLIVENANGCRDTMLRSQYIRLTHPVADFALSTAIVCRDVAVQFTDVSTPDTTLTNWLWDFGDGNTSTQQNPSYIYTVPGTYTVSLSITNALSCGDTEVKAGIIEVLPAPTTLFGVIDTSGCAPFTATFTDMSSPNGSAIIDWSWDFGDGTTSLVQSPAHTFVTPGIYPVTLTTTDANGCVSSYSQNMEAFTLPTANFASLQRVGCAAADITFTDLSTPGSALINGWAWDFGDGGTSNVKNPTYTYTADGTYDVQLTVTDANGCTATLTRTAYIRLSHPQAAFTYAPGQICVGSSVNFTDTSIPDTTLNSWFWDFGDGTTSTQQNPGHVYTVAGTYSVSLTVTNVLNCSDVETQVNIIEVQPGPTAGFTPSTVNGCTPLNVSFTDASTISGAAIVNWQWDFANGNTHTGANPPLQTYTTPGVYSVSLTVTDVNGCSQTFTQDIESFVLPVADFQANQRYACSGVAIDFSDLTTGPVPAVSWAWDFGDGTSSSLQNPTHTYTTNGNYDVELVVIDQNGCTNTVTKTNYIQLTSPQAAFSISDPTGCTGLAVTFSDTSVPDTTLATWLWDFGDGTTSTLQNPNHIYNTPGTYTVSLIITNVVNCSDTEIQVNAVTIFPSPTTSFTVGNNQGCAPFDPQFTDASAGISAAIVDWEWDFGNGDMSNLQTPNYVYPQPGAYLAVLTTTDANGCSSSFDMDITVFDLPTANFFTNTTAGCSPLPVTFNDVSNGPAPIIAWEWDFGDGSTANVQNPTHTYLASGDYTVTLVAFDVNGCNDTLVRTEYIHLSRPTAEFTLTPGVGCPGQDIGFTDLSIPDTTLTDWFWTFGDGTNSTLQNPSHSYANPGTYTVSLTVTNVLGCAHTETKIDTIVINTPPTAQFSATPPQGCAPHQLNFADLSAGAGVAITGWTWDFGDGNVSSLQNPTHTYPAPGLYTVSLTAVDANGCDATVTETVEVFDLPTADFRTNTRVGCAPTAITFFDNSTGPVAVTRWVWDFGDGSVSTIQNPTHTYAADGAYDVELIIFDANGCSDTLLRSAYINLRHPVANFSLTPVSGCPGTEVFFTDTSTPDTTLATWFWDFGDGTNAAAQNPSHVYAAPGFYTVSLTVTNVLGCSDTRTLVDTVEIITGPTADFAPAAPQGCSPFTTSFANLSAPGGAALVSYRWEFGDGQTSVVPNPTHTFMAPGTYDVVLYTTDLNGCVDSVTHPVTALDYPVADFSSSSRVGCSPTAIDFFDLSNGAFSIVGWMWDFGDGNTSTLQFPTHTYAADGTYQVSLTITDAFGCQQTVVRPQYIRLSHPVADFTVSDTMACVGIQIDFQDASIADTTLQTWTWDFGDGTTSNLQNPSHAYAGPGMYSVTLTIENVLGCTDAITQTNLIEVTSGPAADFTPSTLAACTPVSVNFTNTSTGASSPIVSYEWDFGNGSTSTFQNDAMTYTTPGIYSISLIATDALGCQDTIVKQVEARPLPVPVFDANDSTGCAPTTVNFRAQAPGGGSIASWAWNFGDGNNGTGQFPSHVYAADGVYDVTLTVVDQFGCTGTLTKPQYIRLSHPQAGFVPDQTIGCEGMVVRFTDTSIPDTTITDWDWTFGDGQTGTGPNPNHVYANAGTYTIGLTITNVFGCQDTYTLTNGVTILPGPGAVFTASSTIGCMPLDVQFTDASVPNGQGIVTWEWDFGDGGTASSINPNHLFTTAGIFTVQLVVTDNSGCADTTTRDITVHATPQANFFSPDTVGCAANPIRFFDLSSGSATLTNWAWSFGDGSSSTQQHPTHVYPGEGAYTIHLIVTDLNGCTDTLTRVQYVRLTSPDAAFTSVEPLGCPGLTVEFTDTSIPDTTLTSWFWDFGDGTTATQVNPVHVFPAAGTYSVALTVTNVLGCSNTETVLVTVDISFPPTAQFTFDPVGCLPYNVQFTDASASNSAPIVSWLWDFGTGDTSILRNPTYTYTQAGTYTISLTVTDANGCSDQLSQNFIQVARPQADFMVSQRVGCAPETINFTDLSIPTLPITDWLWDFGDGNTSTLQHPAHTYSTDGSYSISLIVTDANGCRDSLTRVNYIRLTHPIADFASLPVSGCIGTSVTFSDQSIPDTTIASWLWDFGDGTTSTQQNPTYLYTTAGQYDVSLTVTNVLGCSHTSIQPGFINIWLPPTALFTASSLSVCAPGLVDFTDVSTSNFGITNWEWTVDGTVHAASQNMSYYFTDPGDVEISMVITDLNGCTDTFRQTVEVHQAPTAEFTASDTLGCAPATLVFSDLTTPTPVSWFWTFGDGTTSTQQNPVHTYDFNGEYTVSLVVEDQNGCRDSVIKPDFIRLDNPRADFQLTYDEGCIPITANFVADVTSGNGISNWFWDFGDGFTGSGETISHEYSTAGLFTVTLVVIDSGGCRDTAREVHVIDAIEDLLPDPIEIYAASVISDDVVQLSFPKFSGNNFSHYSIYREVPGQGFQLIDTLDYINDTIYVDTGTGIGGLNCLDESYCYKVTATNSCGTEGLLNQAQQHCTIELTATPIPGRMLLNWNRYVGWNVEMYEVYRVSSYNPVTAQFLGFVDGNTTSYRDSATECFNDYTYRIRAIGQQNLQEAWSDTSFAINTSGLPAEPGEVVRATVENNREILVEWDAFNPEQISVIYLERSEDDALTWRTLATMPPAEIKYIDNTVQVNRQSYVYRISAQDSCGSVTPVSNVGKTILLNVDRPNGWNRLDWSAYEEWRFGVDHYEIEVFSDSAGVWVLVDIVDGSVLEYEDTQTDLNQGEYCYRVRAHELGNNNARSLSNEVCVPVEHDLFAPNAFTPNGDGVNDLFLLQGIHVREFTIQVFSRWGMKVYESSNLEEGWDGTYLGQKVPEGAYVFVAKGKGFSGRPFVLNGTITLIR